MDDGILRKCVREVKGLESVEEVVLGGIGEPLYSKNIEWVIEELRDKRLVITTNGTIMPEKLMDQFIECVDELVISIDGMNENFESIRHFPLEEILNNISTLNQHKKKNKSKTPKISFQMVITSKNYLDMTKIVELADEYDVDKVIFSNIVPASLEDVDLVMYEMYSKKKLEKHMQKAIVKALVKKIELVIPEIMLKTERRCKFIDDDATMITVDGHVVPCYRLAHDGTEVVFGREKELKAHYFGNIAEDTLLDIWNKDDYYNYRMTVYNNQYPSCMDCDLLEGCDMAKVADVDCFGNVPSCADCLWSRRIVYCV